MYMREEFIKNVKLQMNDVLTEDQLTQLHEVLLSCLANIKLEILDSTEQIQEGKGYLKMYLAAKKVEGCSEKTLAYYETTIEHMLIQVNKNIRCITTGDLRVYLAEYQELRNAGKVTIDNIRRILSGFFSWLEDEDYIIKSPARRIHKIKTAQTIKETFTDENLEMLKNACSNMRDLALLEFLSSTGVRVGEVIRLNRKDINFSERSCVVFGKGDKEREVYFDARTKLHLQMYLNERTDTNEALFVSRYAPNKRLSISGIEKIMKRLGEKVDMQDVHPHKFRRTLATMAIDKGMPVEQVQRLLGHVRIDTTMHYAMVNQANVKHSHRKYIG